MAVKLISRLDDHLNLSFSSVIIILSSRYVIEKIKEDNTSASITTLNYTDYGYTTTDWNSLAAMQGVTNSYTASDGYTYAGEFRSFLRQKQKSENENRFRKL